MTGRILVVDDEASIRQLERYNLEKEGFTCSEAADGPACLERVRRERPDLIVLDIMLPKKDGPEVCRQLKAQPATAAIPIVMLTAKAEEIDTIIGLEMGAAGDGVGVRVRRGFQDGGCAYSLPAS